MSTIQIADNHCHLLSKYYKDPEAKIRDLQESGLEYIVSLGTDFWTNQELLVLKQKISNGFLKIGLGLHPEEVISLGTLATYELERIIHQIIQNIEIIDYIGEIGIDFKYPNAVQYRDLQIQVFQEFCKLAKQFKKPMSIHARGSFQEIIDIIQSVGFDKNTFNGFLHCFTGSFEYGQALIENNFKLGIGGIITYKSGADLRDTVKKLVDYYSGSTLNDLFGLETDSPFLSPEPYRNKTNSPENVKIVAEYLTQFLSKS